MPHYWARRFPFTHREVAMSKKFITAVVAAFVLIAALRRTCCTATCSRTQYNHLPNLMRSRRRRPEAHAVHLRRRSSSTASALVWIYERGRQDKPWMGQGVRFGIAMAAFGPAAKFLIMLGRAAGTAPARPPPDPRREDRVADREPGGGADLQIVAPPAGRDVQHSGASRRETSTSRTDQLQPPPARCDITRPSSEAVSRALVGSPGRFRRRPPTPPRSPRSSGARSAP